ncbi:unnamed protein product [Leptosia nina]|uniref:CUB domain-containing protein n=1 Tax=Leptosia nina TaxID=320188 RepID=A0AAV1JH59_9NEOP
MLKILIYLCVIGYSLDTVLGSGELDYEYYDDNSKEIQASDDEEIPTKHKVEPLGNDYGLFDLDNVKNSNNKDDDLQYSEIKDEDYQIEDNRSDQDAIKDDGDVETNFKLLSGDPDLAPVDDLVKSINEDDKSTEQRPMDHAEFEKAINNYLDETKEKSSKNDILEETKSILREDNGNDFEKIQALNEGADIQNVVDETNKLLNETDDKFDENTLSTQSTESTTKVEENYDSKEKAFNDLLTDLDNLHATWSKLSSDFNDKLNEETNLGYDDNYDKADDQDYEEISDDNLDRIFNDESEENDYDGESYRDDSPAENKENQPIFYLNDALSASDSTPTDTSTTADSKTESTDSIDIVSDTTPIDTISMTDTANTVSDEKESATPKLTKISKTETTKPLPELDEIDSNEKAEFYEKYTAEREALSPTNSTIRLHLSVNNTSILTSPNYPGFYPSNVIVDYIITGEGQGIEMNVTDFAVNGYIGDYVLIIPGQIEQKGSDGIIITYHLNSGRRFRFSDVDRMFIRLETKQGMQYRGFNMTLRNIMPKVEIVDLEKEDEIPTWTSNHTLSVNLGGVSINGFIAKEEEFRRIIADMATLYINAKNIEPGLNTTLQVTQILSRALCFHNWPGSDQCTEITFSVPLVYDNEDLETRFTREDLRDMWNSYSGIDPFAVRLERLGIQEFNYPDDESTLTVWLVIAAGVIISMAMLAFALWRFSCFEEYTKMPAYSDTDSLNEKRVLELYPTPHQTLPPLYTEDNVKWADDVYSPKDTGFANKSYMRDMYDMDSDDEALPTPNRYQSGAISPRDIYNV